MVMGLVRADLKSFVGGKRGTPRSCASRWASSCASRMNYPLYKVVCKGEPALAGLHRVLS